MSLDEPSERIDELLAGWSKGDAAARDALIPLVYLELRKLARAYLRRERQDHTLQPTALVHEVFLRLADQEAVHWEDRKHFFGVTARLMRQVLVDHARGHIAKKRDAGRPKISLTEAFAMSKERPAELLALDESLTQLAVVDSQQARVVEMRVFGGLTVEEVGEVLGISPATVKRDWSMAKSWLANEIRKAGHL